MKLLADTSALLALFLRDDQNHAAAAAFHRQNADVRFLLSDLILAELVTRLRARTGATPAADAAESLLSSSRYEVIFVDRDLFEGALAALRRFADKRLSLTDAASFELISRLGLDGAFTFDRDFRDCGFDARP